MKFSEITVDTVKEYANAYEEDIKLLELILKGAKNYVRSYTGLNDDGLDKHEDISIVVLVLCNEMFENRMYSVDNTKANLVISSILDMYSINLL
ncbi:MAG: head-tail connector protein [Clostridium sp.]